MKKLFNTLMLSTLFLCTASFISCEKENTESDLLIGEWECIQGDGYDFITGVILTFTKDGKFTESYGGFSVSGNYITLSVKDANSKYDYNLKASDETVILIDAGYGYGESDPLIIKALTSQNLTVQVYDNNNSAKFKKIKS
ncbi:MAG: hypothetical protein LBN23_05260 [Paludibacter sp.]|jgi:hypothetical protein|nr:hypothetical protein [Paludibacter sp.]